LTRLGGGALETKNFLKIIARKLAFGLIKLYIAEKLIAMETMILKYGKAIDKAFAIFLFVMGWIIQLSAVAEGADEVVVIVGAVSTILGMVQTLWEFDF
jgi:hypothetical protein